MKNRALQYYMHDGPTAFRIELAGNLDHEGALRLDQDWRTASSAIGDRKLIVDMTFVTNLAEEGKTLLTRWHQKGARLIANSTTSRVLAESILGSPFPANTGDTVAPHRTWLPFHCSFLVSAVILFVLDVIASSSKAKAATLKPETVAAWDDYLQTTNANLQDRMRPGGRFLWTFENAERAAKVHSGEIVVASVTRQNPLKVADGLIHHWVGAMFVPNRKLDDIIEVTRDYDRYKDFYRPSVVESKMIARTSSDDRFRMLIMNKAFFLNSALDADYHTSVVRLDDRRFYSISRTTRVQEVEEYGEPGEYRKREGEGSGYIWQLYSIARLEQSDDGVYVEIEAVALSRQVPAAVRFLVDPIVRRVSRNSLLTSLQKTEEAVGGNSAMVARSASAPAQTRSAPGAAAAFSNKSSMLDEVH
jgi:hypothetical protein